MRANQTDEGVFSNKLVKHIQRTAYGFPRRQRINTNIAGVSFQKGHIAQRFNPDLQVIAPQIGMNSHWAGTSARARQNQSPANPAS